MTQHDSNSNSNGDSDRAGGRIASLECDCGHARLQHAGATAANNGGNECSRCECPLFTAGAGETSETGALPDVKTFYHDCTSSAEPCPLNDPQLAEYECTGAGWYSCQRSNTNTPVGPFATEAEALTDAQASADDDDIPASHPVRPLGPNDEAQSRATCGACGRSWDDAIATSWTPAPSGRCPFEYWHDAPDVDDEQDEQDERLPPCARYMGCLCAGHARGNPADAACDTDENAEVNS